MFTGRYALARHQKQSLLAVLLATVVAAAIALSIARPLRTEIQPNRPIPASMVVAGTEGVPSHNADGQPPTAAARNLDLLARPSTSTTRLESPDQTSPPTRPPVTEPPITEPPITEPPITEPPITEPPITEPPITAHPATKPPVTSPPIPPPPETVPPTTGTIPGFPDRPGDSLVAADRIDELSLPESPNRS